LLQQPPQPPQSHMAKAKLPPPPPAPKTQAQPASNWQTDQAFAVGGKGKAQSPFKDAGPLGGGGSKSLEDTWDEAAPEMNSLASISNNTLRMASAAKEQDAAASQAKAAPQFEEKRPQTPWDAYKPGGWNAQGPSWDQRNPNWNNHFPGAHGWQGGWEGPKESPYRPSDMRPLGAPEAWSGAGSHEIGAGSQDFMAAHKDVSNPYAFPIDREKLLLMRPPVGRRPPNIWFPVMLPMPSLPREVTAVAPDVVRKPAVLPCKVPIGEAASSGARASSSGDQGSGSLQSKPVGEPTSPKQNLDMIAFDDPFMGDFGDGIGMVDEDDDEEDGFVERSPDVPQSRGFSKWFGGKRRHHRGGWPVNGCRQRLRGVQRRRG